MAVPVTLPGLPEITVASWPGRAMPEHELRAALAFLAHKVRKPVHLRAYAGALHYAAEAVNFYICTEDACETPRNVESVTIAGHTHDLETTQRFFPGNPISGQPISDDTGCLLAKVDHNCVTFVVEFTTEDNDAAQAILAYVLEKAIPMLDFNVSQLTGQAQEQMLVAYREFHLAALRRHIHDKTDALRQLEYELEDHYRRLVQAERNKPVLQAELEAIEKLSKNGSEEATRKQAGELHALIASGQYEEITPEADGRLTALTSPIFIVHDDWEFALGRYDIAIDAAGKVVIRSADDTDADGYPHPHVDSSGRPCLGNIAPDLARAIGRMRIAEALSLLREFLNSYNPDNPYIKIGRFDPDYSGEEDENPCEDCEERCTPYCIMSCPHSDMADYTCSDCCDYRTDYCYGECEANRTFNYVHPCDDCDHDRDYCFLECAWNQEWQLSNPCQACEEAECGEECNYFAKAQELNFHKGGTDGTREQPQQAGAPA
ncbi:MAG: hypothetical protein FJ291_00035 [Planctomycetes bacterium]|nr:hypothetical protein [Planctomycetota bacterium]